MGFVERRKKAQMLKMPPMRRTGRIVGNMNNNQPAANDCLCPIESIEGRIGEIGRDKNVLPVASRHEI